MFKLFGRRVDLKIGNKIFTDPDTRIYFTINFNYDEEPNIAEIEILNLSNNTISEIKNGAEVILNAGYVGDIGVIFSGIVQKVEVSPNFPDRIIKIFALDTKETYLNAIINNSYFAGVKASYIIENILGTIGVEIGHFELAKDIEYVNGKICSGNLRNILKEIVIKDCASKLYLQQGAITICPENFGNNINFNLNVETGLIASPTKINKTSIDGVTQADYSVKLLLNHRIRVDSIFDIKSKTANGKYKVIKGTHIKTENDYITECEVISI